MTGYSYRSEKNLPHWRPSGRQCNSDNPFGEGTAFTERIRCTSLQVTRSYKYSDGPTKRRLCQQKYNASRSTVTVLHSRKCQVASDTSLFLFTITKRRLLLQKQIFSSEPFQIKKPRCARGVRGKQIPLASVISL